MKAFVSRSAWTVADRLAALMTALILGYFALAAVPATWWFSPGTPYVADSDTETPPKVGFAREIRRDALMTYQVVIRTTEGLTAVCDPASQAFTYRRGAELPSDIDLVWWTGGDDRCWPREAGTYLMETCWTVEQPFFGLVRPKTVCRESPPFHIEDPAKR